MRGEIAARATIAIVLLALLGGLFVLGGTDWPVSPSPHPDPAELDENYGEYVGQEVELTGEVIDPDDRLILVDHPEGELVLELEGVDELEEGQIVTVAGEVRPDRTIATEPALVDVREPWEVQYMYAISLVGAILAAIVGLNWWRFDARSLSFEPRDTPLHQSMRSGGQMRG